MKKGIISLLITLLSISIIISSQSSVVSADYATKTIYFSNLSETGATQYCPGDYSTKRFSVTGIVVNGIVYIRAYDLQAGLGVSYYIQGNQLNISGNSSPNVYWYNNSNTFGIYRNYSITTRVNEMTNGIYKMTDGTVTQSSSFSYSCQSSTGSPYILYNGYYYVPAKLTALSLGSLIYNEKSAYDTIYDYRVNSNGSPFVDGNDYIVGGKWISGWTNKGNDYLAPHFKINEIWSKNSNDSNYTNQIKISSWQLSVAELVRHYYRNDNSLSIDPGFRGWCQNFNTANATKLSWHTRGRAWDSDGAPLSLRTSVWADMLVNDSWVAQDPTYVQPVSPGIYRTQKINMKEISLGTEMEYYGISWLHIQTDSIYGLLGVHLSLP